MNTAEKRHNNHYTNTVILLIKYLYENRLKCLTHFYKNHGIQLSQS